MNYRVGKHGAIYASNPAEMLTAGTHLTHAEAVHRCNGEKNVKNFLRDGWLVDASQRYEPEDNPHVAAQKPLPHEVDLTQGQEEMVTVDSNPTPVKPHQPSSPVPPSSKYNDWTVDPESLESKDVNELNVMIHERTLPGHSAQQFETVEEARAWLSQDREAEEETSVATAKS